jgi:hypothetical protein
VSLVKYELGFYIPEDVILHSHRSEALKSDMSTYRGEQAILAVLNIVTTKTLSSSLLTISILCREFLHWLLRLAVTANVFV